MSNPQQPELARSRKTPAQDPDATAGVIEGQRQPGAEAPRGPVPPENQPGHHPAEEQDKPDVDAFAERLGVTDSAGNTPPAAPAERTPETARPTTGAPGPMPRAGGVLSRVAVIAVVVALGCLLLGRRRRRSRRR